MAARPHLIFLLLLAAVPLPAQITGSGAATAVSRENRLRDESLVASGVDTGTGAFILERSMMSVTGLQQIDFSIAYNSLLTANKGALGRGWSHPYEAFLDGDSQSIVTVHWDVNRGNRFRFAGSGQDYEPLEVSNRYDHLRRNSDNTWRLTLFDGTRYEFSQGGRLQSLANKINQKLEFDYDSNGRLTTITEPVSNRRITLVYRQDGSGLLQHLQDAEDRVVFFDYDNNSRLAEIRDPVTLGHVFPENAPAVLLPIPDNDPQGLSFNINVDLTDPIGLVLIDSATITHNRPSDLEVRLTSPRGTTATFRTDQAGPNWDFSQFMLDFFDGENPQGNWRVRIIDTRAGETGSLNTFRLKFTERTDPYSLTYDSANRLTLIHGPEGGRVVANTYDSQGRIVAQDDGRDDNQPAMFAYQESSGKVVTTFTDRTGAVQVFEHDAGYNLTRAVDALQKADTFTYDANGNRVSMTDVLGRTTRFSYDDNGNLTRVVDPVGAETVYSYDNQSNLVRIRDPLGHETNYNYDGDNNVTRTTDALNNQDTKTYGGNSEIRGSLLADGAGMTFDYQGGQISLATHPVSGVNGGSRVEYDNIGRVVTMRDGSGFATKTVYNSRGDVTEQTDENGKTTHTEYDRQGRKIRVINPRGGVTSFTYDGNDNIVSLTDAAGNVTRYEFDGEDRLARTIDPLGAVSAYEYDSMGRLLKETDPLGNVIRHEYDAVGNETVLRDAKGVAIEQASFDERNLPIRVVDPLGSAVSMQYDANERLTAVTDALDRRTSFEYDDLDRETTDTDPLGRTANREYLQDDVTSNIENPRGNAVDFQYDPANRMTSFTYPWGSSVRFAYNARDLVDNARYPSGRRLDYQYTATGDVSRIAKSTSSGSEPSLLFSYDANSNLTAIETSSGGGLVNANVGYQYDSLNRVVRYTDLRGDSVSYAYDAAGRMTQLTYPDGKKVRYGYDDAGQLIQVTDWADRVTTYTYDADGLITKIDFPNGAVRQMEYDAAGQIVRRRDLSPQGVVIVDYTYEYDAAGQMRLEASGMRRPPYRPQPVMMTYGATSEQLVSYNSQGVSYDNDGNMVMGPLGDQFGNFQYDAAGNLTQAGSVSYQYDAEDRLVAFTDSSGTTRLTLNPLPDNAQPIVKSGPGGTTRYVWGVGLIYEETPNGIRVHHYDHRGSTVAFTGPNGAVVGTVSYGPFGELGERTGDTGSLFLYNALFGVMTDPNGLAYMRYRWYSPQIKRFLTPDAVFGDIGQPGTLNLYSYAANNPITRNDPGGQFFNIIAGAIAGAVVGVIAQAASDIITGKKPQWQDYAAAAIGGAVGGAIAGACMGVCGPAALIAAGAVAGAVDGAGSVALASAFRGEEPDPNEVITAGLIGFALGGAAGGAGAKLGSKAGKAARVLEDVQPPPRSILKTGASAVRRKAGRVRFNPQTKVRIIDNANVGRKDFPTRMVKVQKYRFSTREASRLNSVNYGRSRSFSGLARSDAKAANRVAASVSSRGRPPLRTRTNIQAAARNDVNAGRGVGGENLAQRRWAVDLRRTGKPLPNSPRRNAGTF